MTTSLPPRPGPRHALPAVADDLRRLDVPIPFVTSSAPSTTTAPATP